MASPPTPAKSAADGATNCGAGEIVEVVVQVQPAEQDGKAPAPPPPPPPPPSGARQQWRNRLASTITKPRAQTVLSSPFGVARADASRRQRPALARGRARAPMPQASLTAYDVTTYGEQWTARERWHFAACATTHLVGMLIMARAERGQAGALSGGGRDSAATRPQR